VRLSVNDFLAENKDYFLNDGYMITVDICEPISGYPRFITFTNQNIYEGNGQKLYDDLDCVVVNGYFSNAFNNLSDLSLFYDIKTLEMWEIEIDDINVFKEFDQLEYLRYSEGFSNEQRKQLRQLLPNCTIY
jgi:hypothetical protein